jgi:hypothetical protein
MAIERALWGSDTPVSAPVLPNRSPETVRVPMQGLGFEPSGLVFDLTQSEWEAIYLPRYAPQDLP